MSAALSKAKAKEEIVKSVRDLYNVKITLPLGNPNLKLVHTNQMLFTELPEETFELANFDKIATALNSSYSRYGGYVLNRWYVEGCKITNDGKTAKMDLDLNPFASDVLKFRDERNSFQKAYTDANNSTSSKTTNTNTTKTNVKSTGSDSLKNVKGFNKSDQEYIKRVVKKALKAKSNPKEPLPKAFAIYEHYNKNHLYDKYDCMRKMKHGFEYTWKKKYHNCGDGAATLVAMYRCAGFKADILHKPGHFYVRVKVNGKYYYCDQAGRSGGRNSRTLGAKGNNNNVWGGISKSASVVGFTYC